MGWFRAAVVGVVVGLIVMLTMNIDGIVNKDMKDPVSKMLFRKRRAIGSKPPMVFGKCGGDHYGRSGWLASPNFPGSSYPALSSCNWTIAVYPRMVIRFDFKFMDMEDAPIQKTGGCLADYLLIREGPKPDDLLVGGQRYCGYDTPFNSVYSTSNKVWVYFASDRDTEGDGFAIRWSATDPPAPQFNCDFEKVNGICVGWRQSTDDQYDWTTHSGETQSGKTTTTGPPADHTKKNELGTYLYTEASGKRKGDKAILISPAVRIRNPTGQCFRFWYHMRGETMGTLNVYKKEVIPGKNTTAELIFTESGNQGKAWRRAQINVTASANKIRILFEGVRGSSYKSDMAIDDIFLNRVACPTPVPITTTTTTTRRTVVTTRRPWRPKPTTRRTTRRTTTTPFTIPTRPPCVGYECKGVGNCIQHDYVCDGYQDCLHEDDEDNCENTATTTPPPTFNTWSEWSAWSTCSHTCGVGRSERTRTCNNGIADSFVGCIGSALEGMECNTNKCLKWNDWGAWSSCTTSCGGGIQTKGRTCDGGNSGQPGCIGPLVQLVNCNEHNCPKLAVWGQWSQCQVTCGNGTIRRTRECEGGQVGIVGCDGNITETALCVNPSSPVCAEWTEWGDFGECSVTCGGGKRTRSRECQQDVGEKSQGCPGSDTESNDCNLDPCPVLQWTDWGDYGECSVSCGGGKRTRLRECQLDGAKSEDCPGSATEANDCNAEACPVLKWTDWGNYSECSTTCGDGKSTRSRQCHLGGVKSDGCTGSATETMDCNLKSCAVPQWVEWGRWSRCSLSCGGGYHARRRVCMLEDKSTPGCRGRSIQSGLCNRDPCPSDPCATNPCKNSGSCVVLRGAGGLPDYVCACPPGYKGKNCDEVSGRICYTGVSTRTAVVPSGSPMLFTSCASPGDSCMIATVGTHVDRASAYVDTAQCAKSSVCKSLTCDDLKKTMPSYEVASCKIVCCDEDYCNTAPMDLPPPPTTTPYTTTARKRTTRKPKPTPTRRTRRPRTTRKPKRTTAAPTLRPQRTTTKKPTPTPTVDTSGPHWSEWQSWQSCTHPCGDNGVRKRFRYCMKGAPGMPGCMPEMGMMGEEPCNTDVSCIRWREWGNWQTCSRTCGGGKQERRRTCNGGAPNSGECMGNELEQQKCNEQSCDATTTAITTTTTTTTTTRKVTTRKPTPPTRKRPRWDKWSNWDACSVSCGPGTQDRTRKCLDGRVGRRGCRGGAKQTQNCNAGVCTTTTEATTTTTAIQRPTWGRWSEWGSCSVSCGRGTTSRSRGCQFGRIGQRGCRGKKIERKPCETTCKEPPTSQPQVECMNRDVRLARRNGRRCPFECFSDSNCDDGKKCVCDGLCGKTCQDISKKCINILAADVEGTITICSNGISVGSKCTFSCKSGYALQGIPDVYCQGTTKWTNQKKLPKCIASATKSVRTTTTKAPPTTKSQTCKFRYVAHDACCGKSSYYSAKARCCAGKIRSAGPEMTECCGNRAYSPKKMGCCAESMYKPSTHKCEDGVVVKK